MNRITRSTHGSKAAIVAALLLGLSGCDRKGDDGVAGGGGAGAGPDDFSIAVSTHGASVGDAGSVRTWGANAFGQLGNGTTTSSNNPTAVAGITTAVQVETGRDFTVVVLADGTLQVFGDNAHGQLGDGTTTASNVPIAANLIDVEQVNILGTSQTVLARTTDGKVWAWGRNELGQIGNGTTTDSSVPVEVVPALNAVDVSGGEFHSLAALANGTVLAWGLNVAGQLGNGTTTSSQTPVTVVGVATATRVAAGGSFSLALLANGTVVAWGDNTLGTLGNGNTTDSTTQVAVQNLTGVAKIDAGTDTAIALKTDGTVWTWGAGGSGQLGNGTSTPAQTTPVMATIPGTETVVDIDAGESTMVAITASGKRYAWGSNATGAFGNGGTTSSNLPVLVSTF